ncbi:MAG TPA: SRPBCC family protein [Acidisarcina sp.]|nr:SRPBCC family protein [Acidisarcina sp.]
MSKATFVYVAYIATTPQKVFDALIDSEATRQYWWNHRNASDWKTGSEWQHQDYDDATKVDIVGKVVESTPPQRLVVTWANPGDAGDPEKHSRVTYQIEPYMDIVRLTVTHEDLEPGSEMLDGISRGWPAVLSSLKTFLETGQPLSISTKRTERPPQ